MYTQKSMDVLVSKINNRVSKRHPDTPLAKGLPCRPYVINSSQDTQSMQEVRTCMHSQCANGWIPLALVIKCNLFSANCTGKYLTELRCLNKHSIQTELLVFIAYKLNLENISSMMHASLDRYCSYKGILNLIWLPYLNFVKSWILEVVLLTKQSTQVFITMGNPGGGTTGARPFSILIYIVL